ncbi:thromboxane A2 receptor-like [Ostrea edulis]|uniref:thromboxane A2 receptor-like n=1 Tax=Ostrea edulis TaxID=37623 RepID=UPI0024AF9539|nr:thromboxane A2 receptor-like [Ostrea edulis]
MSLSAPSTTVAIQNETMTTKSLVNTTVLFSAVFIQNETTTAADDMNSTSIPTTMTTHVYENAAPVSLLFIFGVVGNAIALTVLCCSAKTHKWRPFYRYVCGLAISDGGGILASYPFALYRYISKFNYEFPTPLCAYLGFVFMFTLMSSAMIVCCMSFDRFFATFYPFLYNSPRREFRTNFTLGVVWFLAGIISSLHLYGLGSSKNIYPGSWCFLNFIELGPIDPKSTQNIIYSYIYATTGVIVVLMTIMINTAVIFFFVRNKVGGKRSRKRDLHVIVFLLVIVTVFTSCWAPLMVNILQHASGSITGEGTTELNLLRMGVTNSVVDPWIYILFRKEVILLVISGLERLTGRKYKIKQELSGLSGTGDSNKTSTAVYKTPATDTLDTPTSTTTTHVSDDGGVYRG